MSVSFATSPEQRSPGYRPGFTDGVLPEACPTRTVLDHVTSKWGVLVLLALSADTLRWGELRRVVQGISEKMLAQTLRTLERDGLVVRVAYPEIPPRVEYSLSERGRDLNSHLLPLMGWIDDNATAILGTVAAGTLRAESTGPATRISPAATN
jgi:DNA-binding HxlR family transcriptional regulator